jgi:hypothetical protein
MVEKELKTAVLEQLSTGKKNAITGKIIKQRLGLTDTRPARLAMLELIIKDSIPIVFSSSGYYIAETPDECKEALKKLRSYGVNLFRHYKYLKLSMNNKFSGQIGMRL